MSNRILVALGATLLTLATATTADAAPTSSTPLRASNLTGPPATTVEAGSSLTIKGTVRNVSRTTTRHGRLTIAISRTEGSRPRGVVLGTVKLSILRPNRSATAGVDDRDVR